MSMWTVIGKVLSLLDGLPFQQSICGSKNLSVGPSIVKIRCEIRNIVDNRLLTLGVLRLFSEN